MRLVAPETITFTQSGFCPGCGHGLAVRLIAEVMEEMDLSEKLLTVVDVACGSLNIDSWRFDTIMAAHGRPVATAVGVKKVRPENPVMAYIGDGAAYSIGMAETMHAAIRNDNIVTIVIIWHDRWTVCPYVSARTGYDFHSERKRSEKSRYAILC